ncbi:MAG TPA: type IV toxin-antitoxin system AbiEi family antitoxin domain-containing protein [Vicinamibacterales bacterium]|nr:type IV toxin-antitoxin system AbiEi family antitoxin domain-containing protein [Vicinamibacterales bacterium]
MAADDRKVVAALARAAKGGVVSLPAALHAIDGPPAKAALRLRRLIRHGWIERLRRGLYLVKPLSAAPDQAAIPEDPWVLAREVFSPCYIGGWSAAEHWELTEQIFRSTLVVTAVPARKTELRIGGYDFRVFRVHRTRLAAGVVNVWRGPERVQVSGLERTIADGLRDPELVGGGRHLVQLLRAYGEHKDRNFVRLLDVARHTASGAAWKRLGFLSERLWPAEVKVVTAAGRHLTAGYVRLDPGNRHHGKLSKRWRLWINVPVSDLTSEPAAS